MNKTYRCTIFQKECSNSKYMSNIVQSQPKKSKNNQTNVYHCFHKTLIPFANNQKCVRSQHKPKKKKKIRRNAHLTNPNTLRRQHFLDSDSTKENVVILSKKSLNSKEGQKKLNVLCKPLFERMACSGKKRNNIPVRRKFFNEIDGSESVTYGLVKHYNENRATNTSEQNIVATEENKIILKRSPMISAATNTQGKSYFELKKSNKFIQTHH